MLFSLLTLSSPLAPRHPSPQPSSPLLPGPLLHARCVNIGIAKCLLVFLSYCLLADVLLICVFRQIALLVFSVSTWTYHEFLRLRNQIHVLLLIVYCVFNLLSF